jgi:hypothetical protein
MRSGCRMAHLRRHETGRHYDRERRQGFSVRFDVAEQRGARCMGKGGLWLFMGLSLDFRRAPPPGGDVVEDARA